MLACLDAGMSQVETLSGKLALLEFRVLMFLQPASLSMNVDDNGGYIYINWIYIYVNWTPRRHAANSVFQEWNYFLFSIFVHLGNSPSL